MELLGLRALLAVSDAGSLAAAALATSTPRTTLARRLERLERELGSLLFQRSETGAALTPTGVLVLEEARGVLDDYGGVLRAGGGIGPSVHLTFPGAAAAIAVDLLPQLIEAFGSATAGPRGTGTSGPRLVIGDLPEGTDAWSDPVGEIRRGLHASADYLDRRGMPVGLDDLEGHRLITIGGQTTWPLANGGVVTVEPSIQLPTAEDARRAMIAGLGIALVARAETCRAVLPELVGRRETVRLVLPGTLATRWRER